MNSSENAMVVKDNQLVESSYHLTMNEQRLLLCCISQIQSRESADKNKREFKVHAEDLQSLLEAKDSRNIRRDLKSLTSSLMKRQLHRDYKKDGWEICQWVTSARYSAEDGLTIRFSEEILELLTDMSKNFTKIRLIVLLQLHSTDSIRIYEMLMQWKTTKNLKISVEELQKRLMQRNYARFADFHQRVVKRAITEINKNSDIDVEYTLEKRGRVVTDFVFTYKEKAAKNPLNLPDKSKRVSIFPFPSNINNQTPTQLTYSLREGIPGESWVSFYSKMNGLSAKEKREIEEEEAVRMMK